MAIQIIKFDYQFNINIMRKICFFIIGLLLLFSCSKDGDGLNDVHVGNDTFFSPPAWIQGEWIITSEEHFGISNIKGLKFTNNDFIMVYDEYSESQNWFINKVNSPAVYATEQISATKYIISMHYILSTEVYNFSQKSDFEISCLFKFDDEYDTVWNVTLTKQ